MVRNLPAKQEPQETQVLSLGQEVALEEGIANHASILAWRIPWTEESGGILSKGPKRVKYDLSELACIDLKLFESTSHTEDEPSLMELEELFAFFQSVKLFDCCLDGVTLSKSLTWGTGNRKCVGNLTFLKVRYGLHELVDYFVVLCVLTSLLKH